MALLAGGCGWMNGADWLMVRGDQHRSGFQADERELNARTVKKLQVLWTRHIGNLSDPILLGPIITNRGVKELVFVRDAHTVYAVDADLGTLFWSCSLTASQSNDRAAPCPAVSRISPLLHGPRDQAIVAINSEDQYSDGNRPLYAIDSDGLVHVLRPSTGGDLAPAFLLAPKSSFPVDLREIRDTLYATGSSSCGGVPDHVWSRKIGQSGLELESIAEATLSASNRVAATFTLSGKTWAIEPTANGVTALRLADADSLQAPAPNGVATWKDKSGVRWICTSARDSVVAYRVEDRAGELAALETWRLRDMGESGAPIVANGIVYFVSRSPGPGVGLILHAVEANTGAELFQSREIADELSVGNLALANGHVCFSGSSGTIRCFGIPFIM